MSAPGEPTPYAANVGPADAASPRFSMRRMALLFLLVAAMAALGPAAALMADEWTYRTGRFRAKAAELAELERHARETIKNLRDFDLDPRPTAHAIIADRMRYETELAAYYARLGAKYRRAASRPWEAVPTDPPPPR